MNKKGFTLTELLVVVVILGIISGLSIPLIRNLTAGFEKRKYESYANSVLSAGKLFNDSYGEDLFGHNEYGCAYITYDKLVERRLLNDIEIEGMSCNSPKTYIRVIKQKDKYGYKTYLTCGPKTAGVIETESFSMPNVVPEIDNNSCTGTNNGNLSITADMTQATGKADKNRKKTKITISSGTGINSAMSISAKWSQTSDDHAPEGFAKVDFKVKEEQEESLLNGDIISTTSKELLTPNGDGDYYLIVRVDRLQDLQGNNWRNPDNTDSKYVYFGPFVVDNTAPSINVVTYKCDASLNKEGTQTGSKQIASGSTNEVFALSSMEGTVRGWATSAAYPNGVCIDFEITDNLSIKTSKWEWNHTGLKENATGYKTFDNERVAINTYESGIKTAAVMKSLSGDGHRYARFTVKDYAGNKTSVYIDLKLDKTGPTIPSITNPTNGRWVNTNVALTLSSSDELNNMGEYYYTYNTNATVIGTNSDSEWIKLNGGTGKTSFTTEEVWTNNMNKEVYIKATDSLGNSSSSSNTRIKIDKTKPAPPTIVNSSNGDWVRDNVVLTLSATDSAEGINTCAGIGEYYYSYNATASANGSDPAQQWVKISKGTDKDSFTTDPWTIEENTFFNKTTYVRVCDKAGNCSNASNTDIKMDKVPPTKPTITNPDGNKWTRGLTMTIKSSDEHSGIKTYQYTYSADAPSDTVVTDSDSAETYWRIESGATTSATSYSSDFSKEGNRNVYWRVCDQVGNCSEKTSAHVQIERTPPVCGTVNKTTTGSTAGVSGTVGCSDSNGTHRSGCTSSTFSFSKLKSTSYVTIKDAAGNTNSCKVTVTSEQKTNQVLCGIWIVDKTTKKAGCLVKDYCSTIETSPSTCQGSYGGKFIHATLNGNGKITIGHVYTGVGKWGCAGYISGGDTLFTCYDWKRTPTGGTTGTCFYNCSIPLSGITAEDIYCNEPYTVYK